MVAGITYNFLPFMILPLYASLERIDPRMLEAGYDLYGARRDVFTARDAAAVDAGRRGGRAAHVHPGGRRLHQRRSCSARRKQFMIGNVIQSRYLVLADYPTAAALSFLLMAFC